MHRTAALVFFAVFALYLAMGPVTTEGRGYVPEEIDTAERIMAIFDAGYKGRVVPDMVWNRHGVIPVLFDIPFVKFGKLVTSVDFAMSLSPIFFTAALVTVLFLWLRKLTTPGMSLLLTMTAAFGTMLWPYAYIGLETKQSFFAFFAAYLGLANGRIRTWPKLILFSLVSGLAMAMKGTGIILWPAFAYLIYVQFSGESRLRAKQLLCCVILTALPWAAGEPSRRMYWNPIGGGYANLRGWLVDSPLHFFANNVGIIGSPTKGLLVFSPVLLMAVFAISRSFVKRRDLTLFALLVTGSTLAFLSLLTAPADEVWGPRYMHVVVVPLVLCIGAAWPGFNWKFLCVVLVLAAIGVSISFLGAFFYYGYRGFAMFEAGLNTMEWINGDPLWNEITFYARAFRNWRKGCPSEAWMPNHVWVWETPKGAAPWKAIDLQHFCTPQIVLIRDWSNPIEGALLTLWRICLVSSVLGVLFLIAAIWSTKMEARALRM
ncbi:MAG TPA: hypothetical protein VFR18_08580 [Terriglobia bacterium]|nr:hypothetical protein [Terriglobia bacterium]